jgi:hypothetical protein
MVVSSTVVRDLRPPHTRIHSLLNGVTTGPISSRTWATPDSPTPNYCLHHRYNIIEDLGDNKTLEIVMIDTVCPPPTSASLATNINQHILQPGRGLHSTARITHWSAGFYLAWKKSAIEICACWWLQASRRAIQYHASLGTLFYRCHAYRHHCGDICHG